MPVQLWQGRSALEAGRARAGGPTGTATRRPSKGAREVTRECVTSYKLQITNQTELAAVRTGARGGANATAKGLASCQKGAERKLFSHGRGWQPCAGLGLTTPKLTAGQGCQATPPKKAGRQLRHTSTKPALTGDGDARKPPATSWLHGSAGGTEKGGLLAPSPPNLPLYLF